MHELTCTGTRSPTHSPLNLRSLGLAPEAPRETHSPIPVLTLSGTHSPMHNIQPLCPC